MNSFAFNRPMHRLESNVVKSHSMIYKYLLTALIACALCFLFPYTWDDWAWGSEVGLRRLATWFDNYNGRYIGNLIVLVLTRFRFLRAAVMGCTFTGIIYCVERITQRHWAYTVGLLGLVLLPRLVFRQTVSWISGFSNFTTSALFTLTFFVYLNEHQPDDNCSVSWMNGFFLAVLGICNTLIVENLTVFHVIMSVFLFSYTVKKHKQIRKDYLIYMLSCIAGAAYMFSNSIFHTIVTNPNSYYHIAEGGIIYQTLKNYFGMIYHEGYYNNHFVNAMLLGICYLLYFQFKKNDPQPKLLSVSRTCLIIMTVFQIISMTCFILFGYSYIDYDHLPKVGMEGFISLISLIATIAITLITTRKDRINQKLVFLWTSFIMMVAPLFAVSPIGPRCFISTYFVLILIICELMKCISLDSVPFVQSLKKYYMPVSTVIIILCTGFYFIIFIDIYQGEQERYQSIANELAAGQRTVEVSELPHEDWIWRSVPTKDNEAWKYRFKLFYGIPDDADLIITDNNKK